MMMIIMIIMLIIITIMFKHIYIYIYIYTYIHTYTYVYMYTEEQPLLLGRLALPFGGLCIGDSIGDLAVSETREYRQYREYRRLAVSETREYRPYRRLARPTRPPERLDPGTLVTQILATARELGVSAEPNAELRSHWAEHADRRVGRHGACEKRPEDGSSRIRLLMWARKRSLDTSSVRCTSNISRDVAPQ